MRLVVRVSVYQISEFVFREDGAQPPTVADSISHYPIKEKSAGDQNQLWIVPSRITD